MNQFELRPEDLPEEIAWLCDIVGMERFMTKSLGGAAYVASLMESAAGSLFNFLPAIIFIVACLLGFATGTSWGTMGILIPIVVPIFPNDFRLLIIGIAACEAGGVCGDHCSPISDTTIMRSASSPSRYSSFRSAPGMALAWI